METVSSPFRPYKALSADEISQHSGVYKHLLFWSFKWQMLDRQHSMLNIIYTKHRQRLLQNESATALFMTSPGHALKFEKSWLFGQLVVRLPAVPFATPAGLNLFHVWLILFWVATVVANEVPGEPESMVAIMKISIFFEVGKTRLAAV